jgi:polyisoprenoid-binding protein YceI
MALESWQIDGTHSAVSLTVRHMLISKVRGRFTRFSAKLEFDKDDPTRSAVAVDIEAASIDTGAGDRDTHLRSPDFLDAKGYPLLSYRSRRVEVVSPGRLRIVGDLALRAVSREVVLDTEYGLVSKDPWGNERALFNATASLNRSEFGLTWNQVLEAGGVLVGDRVDIEIEIEAVKQAAGKRA